MRAQFSNRKIIPIYFNLRQTKGYQRNLDFDISAGRSNTSEGVKNSAVIVVDRRIGAAENIFWYCSIQYPFQKADSERCRLAARPRQGRRISGSLSKQETARHLHRPF